MKTFVALLIAFSGCATNAPTTDPHLAEVQEVANGLATHAIDEAPYSMQCDMYGDCAYCEDVTGPNLPYGCSTVCYAYACASGDSGGRCYDDCSLKAN